MKGKAIPITSSGRNPREFKKQQGIGSKWAGTYRR
jgi:hypothetical protein